MTAEEKLKVMGEENTPDFCIHIEFTPNTQNPHRLLKSAGLFIESLQVVDSLLLSSVDTNIRPIFVLEEIEIGSLKLWMKQCLESISDNDLRNLNWKKAVGRYLVKGKHKLLAAMNASPQLPSRHQLEILSVELHTLAQETDVKQMPSYTAIKPVDLAKEIKKINDAIYDLEASDRITFISDDGQAQIYSGIIITQESITELFTENEIENEIEIILVVRRPDFLGETKWEFRHEKKSVSAKIEDEGWLSDYRAAKIDIRPGDALRVKARESVTYDKAGEVIKNEMAIVKVIKIIRVVQEPKLL